MYPSSDDDVVTSPYNSVLAMRQLTEYADCVMPIENQVCLKISYSENYLSFKTFRIEFLMNLMNLAIKLY